MKICALVANFTHSVIVTNSFLSKENKQLKVLFITQFKQKEKLEKITSCYFKNSNVSFLEWGDEKRNFNYDLDVVFAIYGNDLFISKVNSYIKSLGINNVILDLYDISTLKGNIENILSSYDYFLNSQGVQSKNM